MRQHRRSHPAPCSSHLFPLRHIDFRSLKRLLLAAHSSDHRFASIRSGTGSIRGGIIRHTGFELRSGRILAFPSAESARSCSTSFYASSMLSAEASTVLNQFCMEHRPSDHPLSNHRSLLQSLGHSGSELFISLSIDIQRHSPFFTIKIILHLQHIQSWSTSSTLSTLSAPR